MKEWNEMKKEFYMRKICVNYGDGIINFDPESMSDLHPKDIKSYDEYLDIQWASMSTSRSYFSMCYYGQYICNFKGQIERITSTSVLFKRILIEGMYLDGNGFVGKEDHVWMDIKGFEKFKVGDNIKFSAEIYRYIKKSNGKKLDFGLMNPEFIEIIDSYIVPTDDDLFKQQVEQLVCETCLYADHCFMDYCIAGIK